MRAERWLWRFAPLTCLALLHPGIGLAGDDDDFAAPSYAIQPGDVLEVEVWREPDLRKEVLVRSDGGISFPLAGDLLVAGLTISEVKEELTHRIEAYIPDAVVSVAVKEIGGNIVYVVGKVNRPGGFAFAKPIDVMQALSLAGGMTTFADRGTIHILRRSSGVQAALPFDYSDVASGKDLETNILLRSGDTVVVQ